jgi:hypothetical protein
VSEVLHARLSTVCAALDGMIYPLVGMHGDFAPRNVVISDSDVTVIDWGRYGAARSPYQDAARFWADLGDTAINPTIRRGLIHSLRETFSRALAEELNPNLLWAWRVETVLYLAARDGTKTLRQRREVLIRWFSKLHYRRTCAALAVEYDV